MTINDNKNNNCCYLLNAHCVPDTVLSNISWIILCNHYNSLVTLSPFIDEDTGHREKELGRAQSPGAMGLECELSQVTREPVCQTPRVCCLECSNEEIHLGTFPSGSVKGLSLFAHCLDGTTETQH